jgi:transposase
MQPMRKRSGQHASNRASASFFPVKTEAQQVVLSLHRLRAQLMKTRIMQTNELRGLLYEFGVVLPEGHAALLKALPGAMRDARTRLPAMLMNSLDEQLRCKRSFDRALLATRALE